jgi:ATP synthase I chain
MSAPPDRSRHDREGEDPAGSSGPTGLGDAPMRAAVVSVFACGLCFAVIGLAVFGVRAGLGVLIGGVIATVNLVVFARVVQAFLSRRGNTAPWGVVAVLKMVLLFGGVWLVLSSGLVSAFSLAAGYAALPFGVTLASLFGPAPPETDIPPRGRDVVKGRRSKADDEPPP